MANFIAIRVKVGNAHWLGVWGGAAMLLLAGCKPVPLNEQTKAPDKEYRPVMTPTVQDLAVDRAQLLRAMGDAASAAASNTDDSSAQAALEGRQFLLKMPVGCGPQGDAATGWTYDAASQRLVLKATPDIDLAQAQKIGLLPVPVDGAARASSASVPEGDATSGAVSAEQSKTEAQAAALASVSEVEAVDGFWISRPWLFTDSCPAIVAEPAPEPAPEPGALDGTQTTTKAKDTKPKPEAPTPIAALPEPSFGIAHFYTAREPRTGRRGGQAYTITRRVTEGEQFDAASLRLVLRGRLGAGPSGKVIQCAARNPDARPRCVVSATFDRVSFENADGSVIYAQWGGG